MKNDKIISVLKSLIITSFVLIAFSCEHKKDPVIIADSHNTAKFNDDVEKNNSRFIVDAAEALLMEIELAKLAQNNSIKQDVRTFGKIIELEYNNSYFLLKQIAKKKMITIPSQISKDKEKICKDLSYEIADDFDEKYFTLTEKNHKETIDLFEKIKDGSSDPEIKTWAENIIPFLRKNLGSIIVFHQKIKMTQVSNDKLIL